MRRVFDRQDIVNFVDRNSARTYSNMEFRYCRFVSCDISITRNPRKRTVIRNMRFYGCEVTGCSINPAIVEDVLVSNLKTHGLLQTWGAVFKHVRIEGNIGQVMLSPFVSPAWAKPRQQRSFDEANAAYYANVDWALDIREARFYECDIRSVPARLILRDPETQVVVTREKALQGIWKQLDLSRTYWATGIEFLLEFGDDDVVLVAPKRHPKFPDLLDGLKMFRDAGVAEAD